MSDSLAGKQIVVTGGCGDIGGAMALECHRRGAHVTIFDIRSPVAGGRRPARNCATQ